MIRLILPVLTLLLATSFAEGRSFKLVSQPGFTVEPLYGYESIYRTHPKQGMKTRAMYGARVTFGKPLLSAEVEYTRSSDTENSTTAPEKVYFEDDKYKLGINSTAYFGETFFMTGRAGAQGTIGFEEETNAGVKTREDKDLKIDPYAGLKIGLKFGQFRVNASSTVVFKSYQNFKENEVQNTISFGVGY